MKKCVWIMLLYSSGNIIAKFRMAQGGFADEIKSLHSVLEQLI